ncbi:MAG: hypothetical protein ACFCVB_22055 [Nodosilinea sp.]
MTRLRNEALQYLSWGGQTSSPLVMGGGCRVAGACELVNASDQDMFVRSVPVLATDLRDRLGAPIRAMPVMRTIPAGSTVSLPMRLKLHRQTPPGEYTVAVRLGGDRQEFVVQVPERRRLRLAQSQLALVGEPKAKLTQPLGLTNLGNVPLAVGKLGAVILEESGGVCRSVQSSLRGAGNKGYEPFLDALVAELASTRVDMLRVRLLDDGGDLAPGETRALPLEFHLPGDLKPGRRYFGQLNIGPQAVALQVTTLGQDPETRDIK